MDVSRARRFNERMGKAKHYPRHQNLAKGGMVDREHMASGGPLGMQLRPGAVMPPPNPVGGNTTTGGLIGGITQQAGYQAQLAPTNQLNYAPALGSGQTLALNNAPVNQAIGAEQGLAGQYADIAAGRGPNPALAALHQQTGANVANTAALQAGQRGGASNVGLLARQIGQQGAATQQNAVGQEATVQANQQLGALGAQGALQGQIAQQGLGEQGVGANIYGTAANANIGQNNTNVANYAQAQGLNQATALANAKAAQGTQGGLLGGIGSFLGLAEGGEVQHLDNGGGLNVDASLPGAVQPIAPVAVTGPTLGVNTQLPAVQPIQPAAVGGRSVGSFVGDVLKGESGDKDETGMKSLGAGLSGLVHLLAKGGQIHAGPHKSHVANYLYAEGGPVGESVPALVSAKEVYLNPHQVKEVVERGADPMKIGHQFPGQDKVSKNSEKNDVIPVTLEDGGVVLPISVTTHKNAAEKGRKFVERAHAKRHMKKPKGI